MRPECEAAVRAAAGSRQLTQGDIDGIDGRIRVAARELRHTDPDAWAAMGPQDRVQAAAVRARQMHLDQIAATHAAAVRRLQIKLRDDALIAALPAGKQLDGIDVNTFLTHGKSAMSPTEARIRAMQRELFRQFTGPEERFLMDPAKSEALAKEAAGEDSGDAEAKAITKKWQAVNERFRQRMSRAGIPIHALDNWRSPQPWDWARIGGRDAFVQDMLGWTDPREFMNPDGSQQSPEQVRHSLEAAWLTLKTNGANRQAESSRGTAAAGFAARYNQARQLHFKDGASFLDAMRKYGTSDNFGAILHDHWRGMLRDLAIAEQHGPMADLDFRQRVASAKAADMAAAKTEKQARAADAKARHILDKWDVLTRGISPGNAHVAAVMGAIRSVLSASRLGVLVSQQPSDALMSANFLKAIDFHTGRFARDFAEGLVPKGNRSDWLRTVGAWADTMHETTGRFGDTEVWNGISRFLNRTVYVRSGMRMLDRANTSAIAGSFYGTLGDHIASGKTFAELPDASREFLQRHGFNAESWDVLRKAGVSRADGRAVLNPADIYAIPDDALRPMAESRVAGTNAELQERIKQLNLANAREAGWTAKRAAKLADLRERATAAIRQLEARESVRAGTAEGIAAARADVLRAQVERAEVEADIGRYLDTRGQQYRVSDAIDAATDDDRVAPIIQRFAQRVGANGENIGALRARADAKIAAAEKALGDRAAREGARIDAKATEADRQIARHARDLVAFTKEMQAHAARRGDLLAAYREQVGAQVADETARIKDEVTGNLLGAFEDVMHAAGRGYSPTSVTERARMGLTKFEAGTIPGEVARMFYMIRQVPFGLFMTHVFDVPRGMGGWGPRTWYIARYMLGQAIATGVAMQLRHIITGEDPEDMTNWSFAGRMLAGAGMGPLLATLIFGRGNEGDNDPLGKVAGPAGDAFGDFWTGLQQARDNLDKEGHVNWGTVASRGVKFARQNAVPFGNFWYTKAALNHLIYQQLQETVSPGYNDRVSQRLRAMGRRQFWSNGAPLPSRAPDLGNAIGQPAQ